MSLTYAPDAVNGTLPATSANAQVVPADPWESTVELRLYSASAFEWCLADDAGDPDGDWIPVIAGAPFALPLSQAHLKVWTRNRAGTVYWTLLGSKVISL